MESFEMANLDYINKRAMISNIQQKFEKEVNRIIHSGMCDVVNTPLNIIFGVALENIADTYLRGDKKTKTYKELIKA
jgi:hypothetical protein